MTLTRPLAAVAAAVLLALSGCSSTPEDFETYGSGGYGTTESGVSPRVEKPARGANKPYRVLGKNYTPVTGDRPMRQKGTASWYGKQFHGKKTSNGEIYDMYKVSAAHKTMELPSYARVTNLSNGKSIIVRVNDRGPFYGGRIIDLSYEAAKRLGYVQKGTTEVIVERITMSEIASGSWKSSGEAVSHEAVEAMPAEDAVLQAITAETSSSYWSVQIGAFSSADNARAWAAHAEALLSGSGDQASTRITSGKGPVYRVLVGSGMSREAADAEADRISRIIGSQAIPAQR